MTALKANELEKVLDKLFEYMEEKGIKINPDKKDEIKKEMANDLHNTLTAEDVKDVNVQKKLMAGITALVMGQRKDYEKTIDVLKSDDDKKLPDEKLDAKLTAQFMLLTFLSNVLNPDAKKNMELKPDPFKQKLLNKDDEKNNDKTAKKDLSPKELEKQNVIEKLVDESLRNLNGGDNPTIEGEINFPVIGPVVGNLLAFTNQTTPDPKVLTLMVESITVNKNKNDYLGLENSTMVKEMADGIDVGAALAPTLHK